VTAAAEAMLEATQTSPQDYTYVVFHQPNAKFPQTVGSALGFTPEQIKTGLLVPMIGNTYSGAAIIGLTAILDEAKPGDRILMVSYGSGAGSDAMVIEVNELIEERKKLAISTLEYIHRRTEIDYAEYVRMRGKLTMK